ncbi:hypothetical protein [Paenibacillus taichungensis]|nr:hypothetical protein [Paenibacillus taichungensis]
MIFVSYFITHESLGLVDVEGEFGESVAGSSIAEVILSKTNNRGVS